MTPELRVACARSAHVFTLDGKILNGARGSVFILYRLGWRWTWIFGVPPLVWPTELGYRIFAANRPFFFGLLSRFF